VSASPLESRIRERLRRAGVSLDETTLGQLALYYTLLERWGTRMNLTGLALANYPDATVDRLLVEAILAAPHVPDSPLVWFDFGSGGGSPAIPLKVMKPVAELTMVEARARKGAFLREVVSKLGLENARVMTARIEDLVGISGGSSADLVTVRAVKLDSTLFSSAAHLLRPGGRLMLFGAAAIRTLPDELRFKAEVRLQALDGTLTIIERT